MTEVGINGVPHKPAAHPNQSSAGGRQVSGSPVFVAASLLDERMSELSFEDTLGLARLVIECRGGPAFVGGKKGLMSRSTAAASHRAGLVHRVEVGTVDAIYEARVPSMSDRLRSPELRVVGARDSAKLAVEAADRGRALVMEVVETSAGPIKVPLQHGPLDRREFGQLTLDLGSPNPDEDGGRPRGSWPDPRGHDVPRRTGSRKSPSRHRSIHEAGAIQRTTPGRSGPGCRYVLPAHKWMEEWSRRVKPGERPRIILRTFGPVLPVFDVSQVEPTDADAPALPQEIRDPFAMPPILGTEHAFAQSAHTAMSEGIRISQTHDGAGSAGSATLAMGRHPDRCQNRTLETATFPCYGRHRNQPKPRPWCGLRDVGARARTCTAAMLGPRA